MIYTDQFRWDCLGAMGNPDVKTPNLDALAADGDYFIGNPGQGLMAGTFDLGYAFGYNETLHQLSPPSRHRARTGCDGHTHGRRRHVGW